MATKGDRCWCDDCSALYEIDSNGGHGTHQLHNNYTFIPALAVAAIEREAVAARDGEWIEKAGQVSTCCQECDGAIMVLFRDMGVIKP